HEQRGGDQREQLAVARADHPPTCPSSSLRARSNASSCERSLWSGSRLRSAGGSCCAVRPVTYADEYSWIPNGRSYGTPWKTVTEPSLATPRKYTAWLAM